ncbi:MAG TPA: hypothetical protein VGQ12_00740 [Candidatus Angelobacter sp.]|jgi:hypothetical protein|nr:hypothetical protein [Candidatus Angelobacter sp.]
MTRLGICHISFTPGDQPIWYRDLPDIEEQIRLLNIPDEEDLWEWGYCRRSSGEYTAHVAGGFGDLMTYLSAEKIEVDAVLACGPFQNSAECFSDELRAGVLPGISIHPDKLHTVDDRECINVAHALAEARDLIYSGHRYVLILAAEKLEQDRCRFRKYSMVSDFCFAIIVTSVIARCPWELLHVHIGADLDPSEDTGKILMRQLERDCVATVLAVHGLKPPDISKFFYLNLFTPIAEMKAKHTGFASSQIYTEVTKAMAHCNGADPFINLHTYSATGRPGEIYVLCASARAHAAVCLVARLH